MPLTPDEVTPEMEQASDLMNVVEVGPPPSEPEKPREKVEPEGEPKPEGAADYIRESEVDDKEEAELKAEEKEARRAAAESRATQTVKEIISGKRLTTTLAGEDIVLRMPSYEEEENADALQCRRIHELKKQGVPLLGEITEMLAESNVLDRDRIDLIMLSQDLTAREKVNLFTQLLRESPYATLVTSSAEMLASGARYRYLMERCVETPDGKSFWATTQYGSLNKHPRNDLALDIETKLVLYMRDCQDPLFSSALSDARQNGGSVSPSVLSITTQALLTRG